MPELAPAPKRVAAQPELRAVAWLVESTAAAPLKIDRDKGIIYGVKVLGRTSPNSHGQPGATKGTAYSDAALQGALPLYEGASVKTNHPDKRTPQAERDVNHTFGVLRECRVGTDGIRGDLHYYTTHRMAPTVLEDVERDLGQFGLSHNARGEGRVKDGVYLIEAITQVRSVDLVDRPASTRNLREGREATTLKTILESRKPLLSEPRRAWASRLLEMDEMAAPLGAESPAGGDPDAALSDGFKAAATAVIEKAIAGELDPAAALKKLKELLTAHDKLTGDDEPAAPEENAVTKPVTESVTPAAPDAAAAELAALKSEKAARVLCESLDYRPSEDELGALAAIADEKPRKLAAERFKAAAKPPARVLSRSPLLEGRAGGADAAPAHDAKGFVTRVLN